MQIAQISDLHVLDLEAVHIRDFMNKRLTGGLNLLTGRRNAHPIEVMERLVEDLSVQAPDHVVVTGDVTNLSLPGEFQRASRLLRTLGGYDRLTVIPGNHDIYTAGAQRQRRFESYFGHLLFGPDASEDDWIFPAVKDLGNVVIVGLCSALPTAPMMAWGRVGAEQLKRVREKLAGLEQPKRFTIGLVHHNLHKHGGWTESMSWLRDRDEVVSTLLSLDFDMLLHGHTHKAHRFSVSRDGHTMYVIGSGSSTWNSSNPSHVARYNLYQIEDGQLRRIRTRIYDQTRRRFEWLV